MSTQITPMVKRTGKPIIGGILSIMAGTGCVLGALGMGAVAALFGTLGCFPFFIPGLLLGMLAIPVAALGVLAIIGGAFALQRRNWGWALVGTITAILVSHILGIVALILIALSKEEFNT